MEIALALALGLVLGFLLAQVRRSAPTGFTDLQHQLDRVADQLHGLELERAGALGELRQQVHQVRHSNEQLGRQTAALVDALRKPQARGRWGEVQLRRVVEMAGMVDRCDFSEQHVLEGGNRPDLVVHLAGGRTVVVDAKVTLAAYLEAHESDDESHAAERMAAHARHLRAHVDRLADKAYWQQLDSPEFVVLFVPGEAFLAPALEHDPALLDHAYSRGVHLATPTTLVSLLRTVAHGWTTQSVTDDARAVLDAGRELHQRLGVFGAHMDRVGRSLGKAVEAYNASVGSLESQVLPSARRLTHKELDAPAPVDALPRLVSAPELLDRTG